VDVGGQLEGLLGGRARVNWRRRCGLVFGGCCAEVERGKNGEGESGLTSRGVKRGGGGAGTAHSQAEGGAATPARAQ
jgi:hypothetical protein